MLRSSPSAKHSLRSGLLYGRRGQPAVHPAPRRRLAATPSDRQAPMRAIADTYAAPWECCVSDFPLVTPGSAPRTDGADVRKVTHSLACTAWLPMMGPACPPLWLLAQDRASHR